MKKILVLAAFMFLFSQLSAQENKNENMFSLGVSFGSSIPVGTFGSFNPHEKYYNGAKIGEAINMNFKIEINEYLGLTTLVSIFTNNFDVSKPEKEYTKKTNKMIELEASRYISKSLIFGIYYQEQIVKNLSAEMRGGFGISNTTGPNILFKKTEESKKGLFKMGEATSFAQSIGIGLRYRTNEHFLLALYCDYYNTTTQFFTSYDTFPGYFNTFIHYQHINLVNISFGIEYSF